MDEAIAWTIRLREARAGEWQGFTEWLEADPAHLAAYEIVADRDAAAAAAADPVVEEEAAPERRFGRRAVVAGGAAAAAALAAAFAFSTIATAPDLYRIETAPGAQRTIALDGGTEIALNGGTSLLLDRADTRFARLERGEALFAVVRDPSDPFRVEAGEATIRNVGTLFNVVHEGGAVEVEVAQGAVRLAAGGAEVALGAGEAALAGPGGIVLARSEPETIGGWREGQLSWVSASLSEVARDLSRSTGIAVSADPAVAARRFSGAVQVDGDREQLRRRLAALLDVEVRLAGPGWILAPNGR